MIHTVAPVIVLIEVDSGRSEADLIAWSKAFNRHLLEDFGPRYNITASTRVQTPNEMLQPGEWPAFNNAVPSKTDPDGALAYHGRLDDGTPCMHNFDKLAQQYGDQPSQCMNHEIDEALIDELLNEGTQDAAGVWWAKEVCDPCEEIGYQKDGVWLTDFVFPEWFAPPRTPGDMTYNLMGTIKNPFGVLGGGYAQTYDHQKGWQLVGQMRAYRAHLSSLDLGRVARRSASVTA